MIVVKRCARSYPTPQGVQFAQAVNSDDRCDCPIINLFLHKNKANALVAQLFLKKKPSR